MTGASGVINRVQAKSFRNRHSVATTRCRTQLIRSLRKKEYKLRQTLSSRCFYVSKCFTNALFLCAPNISSPTLERSWDHFSVLCDFSCLPTMVLSVTAAFSHFLGEVLSNRFSFLFLSSPESGGAVRSRCRRGVYIPTNGGMGCPGNSVTGGTRNASILAPFWTGIRHCTWPYIAPLSHTFSGT